MATFGQVLKYFFMPPLLIYDAIAKKGAFEQNDDYDYLNMLNAQNVLNAQNLANMQNGQSVKDKAKNIYIYNGLNDSVMGRTLFNVDTNNQQQQTNLNRRNKTLFQ